jgi:hypothetical protein
MLTAGFSVTEPPSGIRPLSGTAGGEPRAPLATTAPSLSLSASALPISPGIVALAVALGIRGALLADGRGAWRAARLSPATALTKTG